MDLDSEAISEFLIDDSDVQWDDQDTSTSENHNAATEDQPNNTTSAYFDDVPPPTADHLSVLSRCFGHKNFRPLQWRIIHSLINERRDNCAIMSTGYGKSLCYQFPSVYCGGITIVISPLISLMEDQVLAMSVMEIPACLLGQAQSKQAEVIEDILDNKYSLVYVTPEFSTGDYGSEVMKEISEKLCVTLIAVDEAHCVSTWGHDFRFQYRQLGVLRDIFPHVPILATTATATPAVRNDIVKMLKLRNPLVTCTGFDRPNLYFAVDLKGSSGREFDDLKKLMERDGDGELKFSGPTIVYCITRKEVEKVSEILKLNAIKCMPYHAGLSIKIRKETHEAFVRDKIDVIVATIAFGMGIDKPDVRNIIHYGASSSIEAYYQEVGRAGRDGMPALCHTFFKTHDFEVLRRMREDSYGSAQHKARKEAMANEMMLYLNTNKCRRQFILNHFENTKNEDPPPKRKCCDNCMKRLTSITSKTDKDEGLHDFTDDAYIFLSGVDAMGGRFGINMYVLFLRGSQSSKLKAHLFKHELYGSGKHKLEEWWKSLANLLLIHRFLCKTELGMKMFTVGLTKKGHDFLSQHREQKSVRLKLAPTQDMLRLLKLQKLKERPERAPNSASTSSFNRNPSLSLGDREGVDKTLYRMLLNKRTELATENDCMPYMIASNEAVLGLAVRQPLTLQQLKDCQLDGFTEAKLNKFGKEFLKVIRSYCGLNPDIDKKNSTVARSIEEILKECPLPDSQIGGSALTTWSLFSRGKTVAEISQERRLATGTVIAHLAQAIKEGFPVRLKDLGVSDKVRRVVTDVMNGLPEGTGMISIKDACPPEVTFDQIRLILAYVQVRKHLKNLGAKYIEIEDEPFDSGKAVDSNYNRDTETVKQSVSPSLLEGILDVPKLSGEITVEKEDFIETTYETVDKNNDFDIISVKKEDNDFDIILDSPPPIFSQESTDSLSVILGGNNSQNSLDNLNALLEAGERLLNENGGDIEPEAKKVKTSDQIDFAGSSNMTEASSKPNEDKEASKSKKVLPPWLKKKRIA